MLLDKKKHSNVYLNEKLKKSAFRWLYEFVCLQMKKPFVTNCCVYLVLEREYTNDGRRENCSSIDSIITISPVKLEPFQRHYCIFYIYNISCFLLGLFLIWFALSLLVCVYWVFERNWVSKRKPVAFFFFSLLFQNKQHDLKHIMAVNKNTVFSAPPGSKFVGGNCRKNSHR